MNKTLVRILSLSIILLLVCSCASKIPKQEELPTTESLLEVDTQQLPDLSSANSPTTHSPYTRTVATETANLFSFLPNPSLFLFIPAHVVNAELIVPGYTTIIKMYAKDQLALPGETISFKRANP